MRDRRDLDHDAADDGDVRHATTAGRTARRAAAADDRQGDHRAGRRRRGAELEAAILAATVVELGEVGYAGLTFEGVAARAETGKASIYRRWPTRQGLVMAAAYSLTADLRFPPEPSTLRADVLSALRQMAAHMSGPAGEAFRGMASVSMVEGPLGEHSVGRGTALMRELVERCRARGEDVADDLGGVALAVTPAMVQHRFLVRGSVDDAWLEALVDEVALPLLQRRMT